MSEWMIHTTRFIIISIFNPEFIFNYDFPFKAPPRLAHEPHQALMVGRQEEFTPFPGESAYCKLYRNEYIMNQQMNGEFTIFFGFSLEQFAIHRHMT